MTQLSSTDQRVRDLIGAYGTNDACLARLLCDRRNPEQPAYRIVAPDLTTQILTYGELRRESELFAAGLAKLGIGPGDRVATLMGKSRNYLVTLMGIWRLGAVHVPLFTAFAPPAIAYRMIGSKARAIICDGNQAAKLTQGQDIPADPPWHVITTGDVSESVLPFDSLMTGEPFEPAVAVGGDAPIIHIFTSGTTGNPKGVVVPMRALAAFQAYAEFGLGIRAEDDVFWCAADPGWAYGLYFGILATLSTGVRSVLFEGGFSPESTMAVLAMERVTNFAAAPTVYRALRTSGLPVAGAVHLRRASSAGEPLTPDVNLWAHDVLGVAVHDHYGQTEAGMLINNHHHPALAAPLKDGAMGRPMPGWTATILHEDRDEEVPVGEIGRVAMVLRDSPLNWFAGYDGDPAKSAEKFSENGLWYVTGDTGRCDEDGYFHFSARDDDVIIMAGYRIGPFEVESVMAKHPGVAECAVIAVPDEVRGEVIEAYVVPREDFAPGPDLEREIQQWVKQHYAAHAFPRRVHFAQNLPKTPSGKIQRFILKQQRRDELAREAH